MALVLVGNISFLFWSGYSSPRARTVIVDLITALDVSFRIARTKHSKATVMFPACIQLKMFQ